MISKTRFSFVNPMLVVLEIGTFAGRGCGLTIGNFRWGSAEPEFGWGKSLRSFRRLSHVTIAAE
jgi:hypothetical protein